VVGLKALFGGSFNPVHVGHLIVARDILETFNFEKIFFVPAYLQPLKGELFLPAELRLELLKVSIEGEKDFSVWDYEIRKGGVSYTIDTLKEFWKVYKEKPVFIMGMDSFNYFHLWKKPKEILKLSKIIVVKRPGYKVDVEKVEESLGTSLRFLEVNRGDFFNNSIFDEVDIVIYNGRSIEISSTEIRNRLQSGQSISYFLPEKALKILWRWWENALQKNV